MNVLRILNVNLNSIAISMLHVNIKNQGKLFACDIIISFIAWQAELASIERNHYISIPVRGYGDSSIPVQCSSDNIPGDTGHWCPLVL